MPKKKRLDSQSEQSERFKNDAQELIDAGELNPDEAERVVDRLVRLTRHTRRDGQVETIAGSHEDPRGDHKGDHGPT
jgi:polyhydroxyalkanoate synthesis regulator phasin